VPATLPNCVVEWFTLVQDDQLLGLALLNLIGLGNHTPAGLIYLALYGVRMRERRAAMAIALSVQHLFRIRPTSSARVARESSQNRDSIDVGTLDLRSEIPLGRNLVF
jgi:hypothetical protein